MNDLAMARFLSPCPAFSSRLAGGLEVELQQWWLDLGTTDHCHPGNISSNSACTNKLLEGSISIALYLTKVF